jgi:Ni/Co efflux regulator RcnB
MTEPMAASEPAAQSSPYMQVQQWKKGDRLPTEFRDRQYVIDDYKQYNLPAPRKGARWVGVGAEYYLVAPNGVIQQVGSGS